MNSLEDIKKYIDTYYEDTEITLFLDYDYCTAFIGVSSDNRAVYDYNLMVEYLMSYADFTIEEAIDWIDYNTIRALSYYKNPPIILFGCNNNY